MNRRESARVLFSRKATATKVTVRDIPARQTIVEPVAEPVIKPAVEPVAEPGQTGGKKKKSKGNKKVGDTPGAEPTT